MAISKAQWQVLKTDLETKLRKSKINAKHGGSFTFKGGSTLGDSPVFTIRFADGYTVMYIKWNPEENWKINQFGTRGMEKPYYESKEISKLKPILEALERAVLKESNRKLRTIGKNAADTEVDIVFPGITINQNGQSVYLTFQQFSDLNSLYQHYRK